MQLGGSKASPGWKLQNKHKWTIFYVGAYLWREPLCEQETRPQCEADSDSCLVTLENTGQFKRERKHLVQHCCNFGAKVNTGQHCPLTIKMFL